MRLDGPSDESPAGTARRRGSIAQYAWSVAPTLRWMRGCPHHQQALADVAVAAFWKWIEEYVSRPHPDIGRRGVVCPFVPAMVRAGGLRVVVDESIDGRDAAAMAARVRAAEAELDAIPLPAHRKSLVLLFPNVVGEDTAMVDRVQASLKHEFVGRGLMLGQFHPRSTEPAARNADFPANRSPVACIALRSMASHDILFLDQDPRFFSEYRARFGEKHDGGRVPDRFLVDRYQTAVARFG